MSPTTRLPSSWPARLTVRHVVRHYGELTGLACEEADVPRFALLATGPRGRVRLQHIVEAHLRIASPHVARVLSHVDDVAVFDCDAVTDLALLADASLANDIMPPYRCAIAFQRIICKAIADAHAATGGPLCFGALSASNLLVGPAGGIWLFGAGENFPVRREDGRFTNLAFMFVAPEAMLGAPLTPAADIYALHGLLLVLAPNVVPHELFEAIFRGEEVPQLSALRQHLFDIQRDVLAPDPAARVGSVEDLMRRHAEIRAVAPTMPQPDFDELARFLASLVEAINTPERGPTRPAVMRIRHAERLATIGDIAIDLSRRVPLWRILRSLVAARSAGDVPVTLEALVAAGWPGEAILPEAARARVHVALSTLRKLGLRDVLVRIGDGYGVDPAVSIDESD